MTAEQNKRCDFKYAQYLVKDDETPAEILNEQERYLTLGPEERREWRYKFLPKMSQACIWNFYWKYIRELEDQYGDYTILDEINQDVPYLNEKLDKTVEEYEKAKTQYEQLIASRTAESEQQQPSPDCADDMQ